jgi:hypothetical protein
VGADPFPKKTIAAEFAYRAVMVADSYGPVGLADGLEMQRRMEGIQLPQPVILPR